LPGERNAGHFVRPPSSYSCVMQTPCPGFGLRFWRKTQAFDELAEYSVVQNGDEKVVSGTKSGIGCLGSACASELLEVRELLRDFGGQHLMPGCSDQHVVLDAYADAAVALGGSVDGRGKVQSRLDRKHHPGLENPRF